MKISMMWMTRKRSHELVYSLSSFIMNANNNKDIEYIVTADPDDNETVTALEKIVGMTCANDAEITYCAADKRYGYEELEAYQNLGASIFTGECLMVINDDVVCLKKGWDDNLRNELVKSIDKPVWIDAHIACLGINRKWYETVGSFAGSRASDEYLRDLGIAANIDPLKPLMEIVHIQRGRDQIKFFKDGQQKIIPGLPDDGIGGYPTKTPKPPKYYHKTFHPSTHETNFIEGKKRFDNDLTKLLGNVKNN